jgi:hypothetical protein
MPPKKPGPGKKPLPAVSSQQKTALSSMFKCIESRDSSYQECSMCHEKVKSCLFNDHLNTKCPNRVSLSDKKDNINDDIIFLYVKTHGSSSSTSVPSNNLNIIHKKLSQTTDRGDFKKTTTSTDEIIDEKPAKQMKLDIDIKPEVVEESKQEFMNVGESTKNEIAINDEEVITFLT